MPSLKCTKCGRVLGSILSDVVHADITIACPKCSPEGGFKMSIRPLGGDKEC